MATGGEDSGNDGKEVEKANKKQEQDEAAGDKVGSWLWSGVKVGAALKVGAMLGVTTLGATALGAVAVGAYAALKIVGSIESPEEEEDCRGDVKEGDAEKKDKEYLPSPEQAPSDCDSGTKREFSSNLVEDLNEYYRSVIRSSSAKRMAIRDLVEKARQPLSMFLVKNHGSLVEGELVPAASDRLITKHQDERTLFLPLTVDCRMWEICDAGESVLEMRGFFCVRRINLDDFSIGTSPWDPFLSGSYLNPELLQRFLKKKIQLSLDEEKVLGLDYDVKWNGSSIELIIENPVKGYADMLCIKIIPCMKVEKGEKTITVIAQSGTPYQESAALSSIPQENLWLHSLEEEAVLEMESLDEDGGCRKKCLLILKSLLSTEPSMKMLTLYHLLTVLLEVCEEETEWEEEMLAERFLDLLKALEGYLRADNLAHHCSPEDVAESLKWLAHLLQSNECIADLIYDRLFKGTK
ncbi:mitochondrial dynamics protein MID49-like [Acanthaster planci]|uniref:Mitochondrial dynamics protein MID49-like n=1 Tax=Acanthaster planci TaxID=133434 RepID=A0A8B7YK68_ACAPL|nr:mitochondrial dynamics protein MID49-like [Acanthaster planci]XP_022093659.1 mitochondrial dynamics protein MID49-like [Acanthaster planci]XP_022093660.1 mitochondrial dynamics protein MID49-like [Acanthaster planci]XP_022093661.1 mitochondrial dynamics protein MID49-like [Acanthaster planci]